MSSRSQSREQTGSRSANAPARRRQHHARSKKGCATCKDRHIRCDERMPFCRNCVRVGRVCIYTTSTTPSRATTPDPPTASQIDHPMAESSVFLAPPGGQPELLWHPEDDGGHDASQHSISFQGGMSSIALAIVQQSYRISTRRSSLPDRPLLLLEDQLPEFSDINGVHGCVQYALVSFGAYIFDQANKSVRSKELFLSHACAALEKLQHEISIFSQENADAIVTASIILAGTAQDWEQWTVFIEGYSMALSEIKRNGWKTAYPELLGEDFQLRGFSPIDDDTSSLWRSGGRIEYRVSGVIESIQAAANFMASEIWSAIGFQDLEQLAYTVLEAISLETESATYDKLAWLRSWMFWIELRRTNGENEQRALSCHFYALLAAVVPLFPARYQSSLLRSSISKMRNIMDEMDEDSAAKFGLSKLLESGSTQF